MASSDETENPISNTSASEQDSVENASPETAFSQTAFSHAEARHSELIWNGLTVLVWFAILFVLVGFGLLYAHRDHPLILFQPAAPSPSAPQMPLMLAETVTAPPTAVVQDMEATQTPTVRSLEPTWTFTPRPTATLTATAGPSPTATVYSAYPFVLRSDPKTVDATTFTGHDACKLWVAGQTLDTQGAPMVGITVMLGGYLDGRTVQELSLTGTALQYGQAGYEFTIRDAPIQSKNALWVMLFDQSMSPLSNKIYFDTSASCDANLVLINFKQVR